MKLCSKNKGGQNLKLTALSYIFPKSGDHAALPLLSVTVFFIAVILNVWKPSGCLLYHRLNIHKFYVVFKVFCTDCNTKSDF
jgi:hypothetical protein